MQYSDQHVKPVGRKGLADAARHVASYAVIAAAGLTVAGCGISNLTSGIGGGLFSGGQAKSGDKQAVTSENLLIAAKADGPGPQGVGADTAPGCPRFQVWSREGHVTIYEQGRAGDALSVMHRGEITKTARECVVEKGRMYIKYGFSGRILLGPKGKTGQVELPVTVFVTDGKRERVVTEPLKVVVSMVLDKPIGYFSAVREVTIPIPEGARAGEFEIFVGFDRNAPGAG
jgi:hypothetical protein